ncbi:barstar family protein [Anaerolentibacter hominis]|uniref:barstar family protein n=1 Tax=Anaerolentibacter hominis TaxID=3079009 RepID=UPI0031B7F2C3
MKQIILDGRRMTNEKSTLRHIASQMAFPPSCGKTLEELEDMLMSIEQPMEVIFLRQKEMLESLEDFGDEILETFMNCTQENDHLDLYIAEPVFED